jgi:RimJ/RimL family protein N-acetyltransferase
MMNYVGHWAVMGFGYWAVEEKSSGQFIGEVGFADFKRGIEPSIKGLPELGWALASHVYGQGFATEALQAAIAWGDARLSSGKTVCIIDPSNLASIRVAEKCGYCEIMRTTYNGAPTVIFTRVRSTSLSQA